MKIIRLPLFLMFVTIALVIMLERANPADAVPWKITPLIRPLYGLSSGEPVDFVSDSLIHDEDAYVEDLKLKNLFSERDLINNLQLKMLPEALYYKVHFWNSKNNRCITASAPGTDRRHHFVNSYLIGYEPFKTDIPWMPLYVISTRISCAPDYIPGMESVDIWETSKEAFLNACGDCEDHAVLLADWLINMGMDARVVLGVWRRGGHAWVVVFKDKNVYLLESTDKNSKNSWRYYPLAAASVDYHPICMFNRDYFWLNEGSILTTNYNSQRWARASQFFKGSHYSINPKK